jgi:DUF1009 family protein
MAASIAGLKSATATWSKGGTPPKGPLHSASNGFLLVLVWVVVAVGVLEVLIVLLVLAQCESVKTVMAGKASHRPAWANLLLMVVSLYKVQSFW